MVLGDLQIPFFLVVANQEFLGFDIEGIGARSDLDVAHAAGWVEVIHHQLTHIASELLVGRIGRHALDHLVDLGAFVLALGGLREKLFAFGGFP